MIRRVKMKLSDATLDVLKNFSTINQNILVKEGSKFRTMSTMKNILGEANIGEVFPKEFGIYDLNEFLGVLSLTKDADLDFDNDSFTEIAMALGSFSRKILLIEIKNPKDPSSVTIDDEIISPDLSTGFGKIHLFSEDYDGDGDHDLIAVNVEFENNKTLARRINIDLIKRVFTFR